MGMTNNYDLRFSVGLDRTSWNKFKHELNEQTSKTIKIDMDWTKLFDLRNQLSKGLDTTVRIHVDTSELKQIANSYKMNFAQQPLTADDFLANSTVDQFNKRVNALKSSSAELENLERKLRNLTNKQNEALANGNPLSTTDSKALKDLKARYAEVYKEVSNSIISLSADPRFNDVDKMVEGMIEADAARLRKVRFRSITELSKSIVQKTSSNPKQQNPYLDGAVSSKELTNERQYLENANAIKAELATFAATHNISDAIGVNQLTLDQLSEAVALMRELKKANDGLIGVGAKRKQVQVPEWYSEYEKAFNLYYSRGQEVSGMITNEPQVDVESAQSALDNLKSQVSAGLSNVPITSFEATSAIATLKTDIETQLATVKIGRTIRFTGVNGGKTTEDSVILSDVQVGHFTITPEAQTQLVNDVQSQLNNVTMHLNTDETTIAQAFENINKSYERKLSRLVNSINTRLKNPVIEEFDATTAIEKLAEDIKRGINNMRFEINGQVAQGTIQNRLEPLRYGSREAMSTGLASMISKSNKYIKSIQSWTNVQAADDATLGRFANYQTQLKEFQRELNQMNGGEFVLGLAQANTQMESLISESIQLRDIYEDLSARANLQNSIDKAIKTAKDNVAKLSKFAPSEQIAKVMAEYQGVNGQDGLIQKLEAVGAKYSTPNGLASQLEDANNEAIELLTITTQLNTQVEQIGRENAIANAMRAADREANSVAKSIAVLQKKMDQSLTTNSKGFQQTRFREVYNSIYSRLTDPSANLTGDDVQRLSTEFTQLEAQMRAVGATGKSTREVIGGMFKKFGGWAMVTSTVHRAYMMFMRMYSAVKEVDTALTNLRKVTDATEADLTRFMNNVGASAHKMGSSMSDLVNATAEFSRLGYDLTQSQQLGELATMYKTVAEDLDITTASQSIVSTLKAFEKAGISAERIVDVFNYVGNNFAISSAGIGEAMQRSAASLQTANNSLEQSVALITAA